MLVNDYLRQPDYTKFGNADKGPVAFQFCLSGLLRQIEVIGGGKPVTASVCRPVLFLPFFHHLGHARKSMVIAFQPLQFTGASIA